MSVLLLLDLPRDVHINVLLYLKTKDLLSIRKTCKYFDDLTRLRSIWLSLCYYEVVSKGTPFPFKLRPKSLADLASIEIDAIELEQRTRFALTLNAAWMRGIDWPHRILDFKGGPANGLQSVHFVLRRKREWIITLSGGIWPAIGCWDLSAEEKEDESSSKLEVDGPLKVGEWTSKGATLDTVIVDQNIDSDACFAVSVDNYSQRKRYIEIQAIRCVPNKHEVSFHTIKVLDTDYSPILLDGNIIAISDEYAETKILNWRTGEYAVLRSEQSDEEVIQRNKCLQVLFVDKAILVARFRSVEIFPEVTLYHHDKDIKTVLPLRTFTHGWINGLVMAQLQDPTPNTLSSIGILLHEKYEDPWTYNTPFVVPFRLYPDSSYSPSIESSCPYQFPPQRIAKMPLTKTSTQCSSLALGSAGTAFWIGIKDDGRGYQVLNTLVLTGTINDHGNKDRAEPRSIFQIEGGLWTSMDYVESRGCFALGAVDGSVKILYIA